MAKIATKYQLSWKTGPSILLNDDLLVGHEDKIFFKLRASHWQIMKVLCGSPQKNATLASSTKPQELKELRDKKIQKVVAPAPEDSLGMESKQKPAKRAKQTDDFVVQIEIPNEMKTKVSILCPSFKPTRADLQVELVEDQLTAVLEHLEEDIQELQVERPPKRPKKSSQQSGRPEASESQAKSSA